MKTKLKSPIDKTLAHIDNKRWAELSWALSWVELFAPTLHTRSGWMVNCSQMKFIENKTKIKLLPQTYKPHKIKKKKTQCLLYNTINNQMCFCENVTFFIFILFSYFFSGFTYFEKRCLRTVTNKITMILINNLFVFFANGSGYCQSINRDTEMLTGHSLFFRANAPQSNKARLAGVDLNH